MALDILIVDDEADIREMVSGLLEDEGFDCRTAGGSDEALRQIESRVPSIVLLDIWLEGSPVDGIGLLQMIKKENPELIVVMMSGHGNIETAVTAIKAGAYDFIEKPFEADRLILTMERAAQMARLAKENRELQRRSGGENRLIGQSSGISQVRSLIDKTAGTGSRVLIEGPAGSGKEVAARLLHAKSRRADGPFLVLNAASMDPEHLEEELFGVESHNSDGGRRTGVLEQAHRGTLFIDEIAEMPSETQARILRVLLDQSFKRIGGNAEVSVDVRIISASSQNLKELIDSGKFRQDLYHRLAVVPIRLPALKERLDDVPVLASHFVDRLSEAIGSRPLQLGDDAITAMQSYAWPGNVRELRNLVERLLIMCRDDERGEIGAEMLPEEFHGEQPADLKTERGAQLLSMPLREAREVFEREYLLSQINRFGGNISRTAAFVGMERSALHRKLKLLGVNSSEAKKGDK